MTNNVNQKTLKTSPSGWYRDTPTQFACPGVGRIEIHDKWLVYEDATTGRWLRAYSWVSDYPDGLIRNVHWAPGITWSGARSVAKSDLAAIQNHIDEVNGLIDDFQFKNIKPGDKQKHDEAQSEWEKAWAKYMDVIVYLEGLEI